MLYIMSSMTIKQHYNDWHGAQSATTNSRRLLGVAAPMCFWFMCSSHHQAAFCRAQIKPSTISLSLAVCVCVQGVSYGVFGLGNKQYEHFCAVGHKVHAAMEQLGAQPVVRRGDGDDDVDIDADFEGWRTELYTSLDGSSLLDKREVCYVAHHSTLHGGRCIPLFCVQLHSRSAIMSKHTKGC